MPQSSLWLVERTDVLYWNQYSSAVVVADSEQDAKKVSLDGKQPGDKNRSWANPDKVQATYLGTTELKPGRIILAYFHSTKRFQ